MPKDNKTIGMVIYANPDCYPPVISAVNILGEEFNPLILCRNQGEARITYPLNARILRLGALKTPREKEAQNIFLKIFEYCAFVLKTVIRLRRNNCGVIYSYDMHGFLAAFIASRFGRKIPIVYHNLDLCDLRSIRGLSKIIKYFELIFSKHAEGIVIPDKERAEVFKAENKVKIEPIIAMNAPLKRDKLPNNRLKDILLQKGFPAGTRAVLYQGTITKKRLTPETIKSMPLWPKDTVLVIQGVVFDDYLREINNYALELGVQGRVIYLSSVPYSQVCNYASGAFLGLALFNPENLNLRFIAGASNKIFEYLSVGVPAVINDSKNLRSVFNDSLVYFTRYDSTEEIARVINQAAANHEEYSAKAGAARAAHLESYNYEVQFAEVLKLIKAIYK